MDSSHADGIFRRQPMEDSAGFGDSGGGDGRFRRRTMEDSAARKDRGDARRRRRSSSGHSTDKLSLFSSLESEEEPVLGTVVDNPVNEGLTLVVRSQKSNLNIDWFKDRIPTRGGTAAAESSAAPNSATAFLLSIAHDCISNCSAALIPMHSYTIVAGASRVTTILRLAIFLCLGISISLFCYLWGRLSHNAGGGGITLQARTPNTAAVNPSDFPIYRLLPY
jgi:hypothetical protein